MSTARRVVRWLLLGRRDGVRASLRRRLGFLTWLDRSRERRVDPAPDAAPAAPPPPDGGEWTDLGSVDEVAPGEVIEVLIGERPIALACEAAAGGRRFHAVDGVCPHAGGPLGDGVLEGNTLTCPWHGWSYDLTTGRAVVDPAIGIQVFECREEGGRVQARLVAAPDSGAA